VGSCAVLVGLVLSALPGCKDDGLSEYERMKKRQEEAGQSLRDAGMKATRVRYPQGEAWSLDLSGMQITDDMLNQLKGMGPISEMKLNGSTLTDEHLAVLNEPELGSLLLKLDLSNTAVTGAGLEKLTNLLVLADLNLAGTKVTSADVQRFRQRRQQDPKVRIKNTNVRLK
jgi:hypothetical protein